MKPDSSAILTESANIEPPAGSKRESQPQTFMITTRFSQCELLYPQCGIWGYASRQTLKPEGAFLDNPLLRDRADVDPGIAWP